MARHVLNFFRGVYQRISDFTVPRLNALDNNADWDSHSREWVNMRAELEIRKCLYPEDLYEVAVESFYLLFPDVVCCQLYLKVDSLRDAKGLPFPSDPLCSRLTECRELKQNERLSETDELFRLLRTSAESDILLTKGVSYLPIFHPVGRKKLVSVVVFVSEEIPLDKETADRFQLFISWISQTFIAMQARYHASTVSLIAQLSAIDDNIAQGQMAVVKHLKAEVGADSGFLLAYSRSDDDFVLKALDDAIISEKRFPCQSLPTFQSRLSLAKPMLTICTGDMQKDIATVGIKGAAAQCLISPVNQNTQLIGFVVLLSQTHSFTMEHLGIVSANLSLSGSLLYKDMVVERERTLREQTEKLHQVAKNIFTHLGDHFASVIKEKYQRLSDHIVLSEAPCSLSATRSYSHYKNIFIPPIDIQRLTSLDNKLIVIGPGSLRYRQSPDQELFRNWSKDTCLSSVLSMCDLNISGVTEMVELDEADLEMLLLREIREAVAGNLGDITEEAETSQQASLQDAVSSRRLTVQSVVSVHSDHQPEWIAPVETDANNNADREMSPAPQSTGSKLSVAKARPSTSLPAPPAQQIPPNDVVSQILETAGGTQAPHSSSSRTSIFALRQRSSNIRMSASSATIGRHSVRLSKQRLPKKRSFVSVLPAAKSSITNPSPINDDLFARPSRQSSKSTKMSVDDASATFENALVRETKLKSSVPEVNRNPIGLLPILASKCGVIERKDSALSGESMQTAGGKIGVHIEPEERSNGNEDGVAGSESVAMRDGSSTSYSDDGSTMASRNDSEESVDLRSFQAALKKDFIMPGKTILDREKAMFHSILEYKRRSILEENLRTERLDSNASDVKSRFDNSDSVTTRHSSKLGKSSRLAILENKSHEADLKAPLPKKSSLSVNKDPGLERKFMVVSQDHLNTLTANNKAVKYGSQFSMVDVTLGGKTKVIAESNSAVRRSVVNLDPKIKESNDARFAVADRLERARNPERQFSGTIQDSKILNMAIHAADGAAGPLRRKPSRTESAAKLRMYSVESKNADLLHVTLPPRRASAVPLNSHRKSVVSEDNFASRFNELEVQKCSIAVQANMSSIADSMDLDSLRSRARDSSDATSQIHAHFRRVSGQQSYMHLNVPIRSSSLIEQYMASAKKKSSSGQSGRMVVPLTPVTPPTECLIPLVFPLSGTVLQSLTAVTSSISLSKKDSDIETLLRRSRSACALTSSTERRNCRIKGRWCEVQVVDMDTGDSEIFPWRETTIQLCKYSPDTHCLTSDIDNDLTILLKEIMQEARNLCHAERCSVFLLENDETELVAKVFDGDIAAAEHEEVRISATEGVVGHVVQTGKILNIKDAYSHPLFYRGVDDSTGFRTRCILCFPIKDEKDVIIGAAQLCNKTTGPHFDSTDEVIANALATYCCISIVNSLMYKDVLDAHNRVKLANELMVFHMHVPPQDVVELVNQPVAPLTSFGDDLHLLDFNKSLPRSIDCNSTPVAVISMVHELDLAKNFRIKSNTLARFVLMVKKGYREPPYHNWSHAFSVAHFAYLILRNLKCISENILDELEAMAFFVAALCHDIDHRGTSNSFQVASNSVLAALYSSEGSVMERHHFSQTMCILNTEGCNIFESVSRREYQQLLDLIRDIILSTDIAHHLRIRGGLEAMAESGFEKTSAEHKSLLLCLFMTSADLADQTKPWTAAKRVSKMLYKEFFSQGDLEKALGRNPMEMMDRERASIPDLQIGFIDHIVLPAFSSLCTIFPTTECLVNNIKDNREHWYTIKNKTADRRDSITSLDVFDFIDAEDERTSSGEEA